MRQVLGADYDQLLLLAPTMEEWIGPRHPARFIREFVAALDLKALGLDTLDRSEGGVAYEPALLLQAWLYGYQRKVRSTRALEAACREEMGFVWLTGNRQPDHNALWRFWNEHREGIHQLFRQSVKVAIELNLVGLVVQAVDGTKIMAASSGRGGFGRKELEKLLQRLDQQIAERAREIETAAEGAPTPPVESMVKLREQVRAALARVSAGEVKHAHPLEPQAVRMECDGRNRFGYNAQAVVDAKEQVIVAADAVSAAHDSAQLTPMIADAAANTGAEPLTLADGGYANGSQLRAAHDAGFEVVTPPPSSWCDTAHPYHVAHFQHDPQRKVVICPQRQILTYRGERQKDGHQVEIYRNAKACRDCPVRALCTSDPQGRAIYIGPGHAQIVAAHAAWQQPQTAALYSRRAPTVEPVFAQVKQQMNFRRWTVRGRDKVRAQWHLLATTWNLRVIMRHWMGGTQLGTNRNRRPTPPNGRFGLFGCCFGSAGAALRTLAELFVPDTAGAENCSAIC